MKPERNPVFHNSMLQTWLNRKAYGEDLDPLDVPTREQERLERDVQEAIPEVAAAYVREFGGAFMRERIKELGYYSPERMEAIGNGMKEYANAYFYGVLENKVEDLVAEAIESRVDSQRVEIEERATDMTDMELPRDSEDFREAYKVNVGAALDDFLTDDELFRDPVRYLIENRYDEIKERAEEEVKDAYDQEATYEWLRRNP